MLNFKIENEEKYDDDHHVANIVGQFEEGDVTVACWEPGQTSPIHAHPYLTEIYFCVKGGGKMTTDDKVVDMSPGDFVVHPRGEVHEYENGSKRSVLYRVRYGEARDFSAVRKGWRENFDTEKKDGI